MMLFFVLFSLLFSENPVVINSGSFQGLANPSGEILIPPVYDQIGWSNGDRNVQDGVIGFEQQGRWGLISLKNKKLTKPAYQVLRPFSEGVVLAAIKGKFTNLPFYGLLNVRGEPILSFEYFQLEQLSPQFIRTSIYDRGVVKYGLRTWSKEVLGPRFKKIELDNGLIIGVHFDGKKSCYTSDGIPIIQFIDTYSWDSGHWSIMKDGKYGSISKSGKLVLEPRYKAIKGGVPFEFNEWEIKNVTDNSSVLVEADSLATTDEHEIFIAHTNHANQFVSATELLKDPLQTLVYMAKGYMVLRDQLNDQWSLFKTNSTPVLQEQDSIHVDTDYFFSLKEDKWHIYNGFGQKVNTKPYAGLSSSHNGRIPVMKNGYWGWIEFDGRTIVGHKYDFVGAGLSAGHFIAKYIEGVGVFDFSDRIVIKPDFKTLVKTLNFYIGQKGQASYVFDVDGALVLRTGSELVQEESLLMILEDSLKGCLTKFQFMIDPHYDQITQIDDYLVLRRGNSASIVHQNGTWVLRADEQVEDVKGFAEDYFHIVKDGKHGFVDLNGNLRVANRYENAQNFEGGLAPVLIGRKWGFIDKAEQLVVQPYYDWVSTFADGIAIVMDDNQYGLIDSEGEVIEPLKWANIARLPTRNYRLINIDGQIGLADSYGKFLLRPNYTFLEDHSNKLVVVSNGSKKGVLTYNGYTQVPFDYDEIKIEGDYLLLLKERQYVPSRP